MIAKKKEMTNSLYLYAAVALIVGVVLGLIVAQSIQKNQIAGQASKVVQSSIPSFPTYATLSTNYQLVHPPLVYPKTADLMDDDSRLGKDTAPVVIVMFGGYQEPYTAVAEGRAPLPGYTASVPAIISDYVSTGKVQLVFRDFPLSFHAEGIPSAIASQCAFAQFAGAPFWVYHSLLLVNHGNLGSDTYKQLAAQIALDPTTFEYCLTAQTSLDEVNKDLQDAQRLGLQGSPTFFIGKRNGQPVMISGAQDYTSFRPIIEAQLRIQQP
ncbi:thioredoxin domain-containing protein [Candidatus Woesearchaeota archaeon]|nr:thioredoxin domain-containing protein [Candidatus Woesearchaeota archaeon]